MRRYLEGLPYPGKNVDGRPTRRSGSYRAGRIGHCQIPALERVPRPFGFGWYFQFRCSSWVPMTIKVEKDWWKTLFDEVYLQTDARSVCDEELTRREVDFLIRKLDLLKADPILDLC